MEGTSLHHPHHLGQLIAGRLRNRAREFVAAPCSQGGVVADTGVGAPDELTASLDVSPRPRLATRPEPSGNPREAR